MSRTHLVAIKSFGDLVIALSAIGHAPVEVRARVRLLLGAHLLALFEAIGMPVAFDLVEHGEPSVPSCFDVRKNGARAAMHSVWRLRRAIAATKPDRLLFDRLGPRERLLAGHVPATALPAAPNIYLAYASAFAPTPDTALGTPPGVVTRVERGHDVGIFPGSRLAVKNMPDADVRHVIAAVEASGLRPRLLLLEGERADLEAGGLPHRLVPRSFAAMIDAVGGCSAIVSADSLPAHLAELRGVPVHVLSPVDNRYWLPHSAFVGDRWSLFGVDVRARIGSFLAAIQEGAR